MRHHEKIIIPLILSILLSLLLQQSLKKSPELFSMILAANTRKGERASSLQTPSYEFKMPEGDGHTLTVDFAHFLGSHNAVTASDSDLTVKIWDLRAGKVVSTIPYPQKTGASIMVLDPDGHRLAAIQYIDKKTTLAIFDLSAGKAVTLCEMPETVYDLEFSPDGHMVAAACGSGLILQDAARAQERSILGMGKEHATSLTFSPDGKIIAVGVGNGAIQLWQRESTSSQSLLGVLQVPGIDEELAKLAFNPKGDLLAAGTNVGRMTLWNIGDCRMTWTGEAHSGWIQEIFFSIDGRAMATFTSDQYDHTAKIWELDNRGTALLRSSFEEPWLIATGALSNDGQIFICGQGSNEARGEIHMRDTISGKLLASLPGHSGGIRMLDFSPDDKTFISASGDGTARIWDRGTKKTLRSLKRKSGHISALSVSADGSLLAAGSSSGIIGIFEVTTGKIRATLDEHNLPILCAAFMKDSSLIISGSADNTADLRDLRTGKVIRVFKNEYSPDTPDSAIFGVGSIAPSPDRSLLAMGGSVSNSGGIPPDGMVLLFDVATGKIVKTLSAGIGAPSIDWSLDNRILVHGDGRDEYATLGVEDMTTMKTVPIRLKDTLEEVKMVAVSPDGLIMAYAGRGKINLLDITSGEPGLTLSISKPYAIKFAPANNFFAVCDEQGVTLYDWKTGEIRASMPLSHDKIPRTLTFNREGTRLFAGCDDGIIRVWDLKDII